MNKSTAKIISIRVGFSNSVLLGKKLIAGDTFNNMPNGMIFPHFANDPKTLLETWQKLFNLGIEEIYPGHGKPFKVEKALTEFEKWKKKILVLNEGIYNKFMDFSGYPNPLNPAGDLKPIYFFGGFQG